MNSVSRLVLKWMWLALAMVLAQPVHADAEAGNVAVNDLGPPPSVEPVDLGSEPLDLENSGGLKGINKVAVAGVVLYVLTESSDGVTSGGAFRDRSMASVSSAIKVTGLSNEVLQRMADSAHDQLVTKLRSRGLAVMPSSELQALPEFAALARLSDVSPLNFDAKAGKGVIVSAKGLPLINMDEKNYLSRMTGGLFGAKVEDHYVSLGNQISAGFKKHDFDLATANLAKAAGATLVMARIVLAPAQVKASGGAFSLSAQTSTKDSLVMPSWINRLWVLQPGGEPARVSLKSHLVSNTPPGRIVDVTSTGTKAANIAVTAFTMLAALNGVGRGVVASTKDMEMQTSPEWFSAVAYPQIDAALTGLSGALAP